jgi:hypothetical protein
MSIQTQPKLLRIYTKIFYRYNLSLKSWKKLTLALCVDILTTKKINKSTQISELFKFQISEASACYYLLLSLYTAVNQNTLSHQWRHISFYLKNFAKYLQKYALGRFYFTYIITTTPKLIPRQALLLVVTYNDTVFVKWRALIIGLVAASKSYSSKSCIEKLTFWNWSVFGWNYIPLYGITCNIIIGVYLTGRS